MSTRFLEANNIKIYAVLSDFAKCRDSRIKSAPRVPKIEGGGVQPIRAMPIFRLLFLNMTSLGHLSVIKMPTKYKNIFSK